MDDLSYDFWAKEPVYCNNLTVFSQAHKVCVSALRRDKWSIMSETAVW